MPGPFDAAAKRTFDQDLPGFAGYLTALLGLPPGVWAIANPDLSHTGLAADRLYRVGDAFLVHVELHANWSGAMPGHLLHYAVTASQHNGGLPVYTVIILLRPLAQAPALTGLLELGQHPDGPRVTFRYHVVRWWEQPLPPLLTGPVALLPFAPLTDEAQRVGLPSVVETVARRLETEIPSQAADLWGLTKTLLGLRFEGDFINSFWREVRGMRESSVYQAILQEGRQEGIEEGRQQGRLEYARHLLRRLGERHLGPPDRRTARRLGAVRDVARLEAMIDRLDSVGSWADLFSPPAS